MQGKTTLILLLVFIVLFGFIYFFEIKGGEKRKERELVEKTALNIPVDSVTTYTIKTDNRELSVRKKDNTWTIVSPVETAGDSSAIVSNLKSILDTKIERKISDDGNDPGQFGLENPRGEIVIQQSGNRESRLFIGDENPTGDFIFVKYSDKPGIYTVSKSLRTYVNKSLYDLRDKRVMHIRPLDVRKIRITSIEKGEVVLKQDGENWNLIEPVKIPAESNDVMSFLNRLSNGRIKAFIDESPRDLRQYGLTDPFIRIELYSGDELAKSTFMIGDTIKDENAGYYAREESRSPVFILENWAVNNLNKGAFDFQVKTLTKFDGDNADRIVFEKGAVSFTVVQKDFREWGFAEPDTLVAETGRMKRWIDGIKDFTVDELETYTPASLQKYGLLQPEIRIRIYENETETGQILIGKPENEFYYTKSANEPYVYKIKCTKVENIDKAIRDLALPPAGYNDGM